MIRHFLLIAALIAFAACGADDLAGPHVLEVFPDAAPAGATVRVHGVGFGEGGEGGRVTVGGVTASAESWSATEIAVVVPEATPGATVLVLDLPDALTEPFPFTVLP